MWCVPKLDEQYVARMDDLLDTLAQPLDVAEPAVELRALHRSLGYVDVSTVQWDGKSYRSVVMEKPLDQSPLREHLRTLARYNRWATRELFVHVDALPDAAYRRDVGLFLENLGRWLGGDPLLNEATDATG